jgi:hypothetical protein
MKLSSWKISYLVLVILLIPLGFYSFFILEALKWFLELMSVSFLFFMPFSMGLLTVAIAPRDWVNKKGFAFYMPWVSVISFCLVTLVFEMESFGCAIMALPLFLFCASAGGIFGRYLISLKKRNNKLNVSLAILLPFLVMPFENTFEAAPTVYTTYTTIDINASKEKIWDHVVRVKEIRETEYDGTLTSFLGLPRPVKGEFDIGAVGGSRQAIFTNGLIFDELITDYIHQRKMSFSIATARLPDGMDEHVEIGGKYFNMLDGNYELEPLGNDRYRLHLYSHFEMKTTFNFYAGWWGDKIMSDIQNSILQVIKTRCENP